MKTEVERFFWHIILIITEQLYYWLVYTHSVILVI